MDKPADLEKSKPKLKNDSSAPNESNTPNNCPDELDPELDALLDDSLADFSSYGAPPKEEKRDKPESKSQTKGASNSPSNPEDDLVRALLRGAMPEEGAAGDFEDHLKNLLHDDPVAMAEFEKLTSTIPGSGSEGSEPQKNFADTLAETLTNLSANAESLKEEMSEDDLLKSFQQSMNLGADGEAAAGGDFIPMMQNMMSSLLSKDILYPSLKDLADKYPAWLSANNGKIPKKQFDLYIKQLDIVSKLCECYDSEKDTDSQKIKDERFEKLLDLMTEMQECGPPPKEIVGELAPGLNFDAAGNPQLPGMDQCSVM